jgi:ABC-type transporter Mla MlaB component
VGTAKGALLSLRRPPEPSTIVYVIDGPIDRAAVPELCERVRVWLEGSDAELVVCDVALVHPDAATVDVLARLQLTARRLGLLVRLSRASRELQELLAFMGLRDVLPALGPASRLGPQRQTEEWEQGRRVEERVESDDLTA